MQEIVKKRNWNSKLFDTGRIDEKERPIYGAKLQDGLHDEEPDGSFVDVNTRFEDYEVGVSTERVIRSRCGEVRISDTGSASKDLAKIKTKRSKGVSLKLKGIQTYGPFFDDLRSCYYNTDNGIKLRYYPHYKGMSIVVEIANPQTASNVYRFSLKEYGCDYSYKEVDGAIKCISSTGEDDLTIKATYAVDGNGDNGSVYMRLGDVVDGYQEVEKVIAPVWLGNAVGPVLSDPDVTIDDDTGTFEDAVTYNGAPNNNYGAFPEMSLYNQPANTESTFIKVDLTSLSGFTVTDSYFGFDVFGATFPLIGNAHVILVPWGEGNKSGAAATAGECSYNHSAHPTLWNTANCRGDGTDRVAAVDGTYTFTGINSDTHFSVSNAAVQGMIDTPATNYGWVFETDDTVKAANIRSSETVTGNKPYIFIEYIAAVSGETSHISFSIYDKHFNAFNELSGKNTII